jgi:hypothetical protein
MNSHLMFRPDLNDCILEDRALMANSNLGIIILTTSGLSLVTPFPGASSSAAGSLGSSGGGGGSSASVSGLPIPQSLYITGGSGISSLRPGNITGNPSVGGGAATAGGLSIPIQVGSGADTAGGPTSNITSGSASVLVSRATVADPLQPSVFAFIGGASTSTNSPVLPPGQSYRDSAPVQPSPPMGVVNQSATGTGSTNNGAFPSLNPQLGAPRLGPFNSTRGMNSSMPGSMVPITPLLPGNN